MCKNQKVICFGEALWDMLPTGVFMASYKEAVPNYSEKDIGKIKNSLP